MCITLPVTHSSTSRTRCKNNGNTWCVHSKRTSGKINKSKNKTNVNETILICLAKNSGGKKTETDCDDCGLFRVTSILLS